MTEAEWLAGGEPSQLMYFLRSQMSDRKSRLFVVASCRAVWPLLTDARSRTAVEIAERLADGLGTESERCNARQGALLAEQAVQLRRRELDWRTLEWKAFARLILPVQIALNSTRLWLSNSPQWACGMDIEATTLRSLIECVFGNPFRPVALDRTWLSSTVVALAEGIYADRAFDRMPILADALQDADCDNDDILTHCRGNGPHVRGCWVIDLLLEKT